MTGCTPTGPYTYSSTSVAEEKEPLLPKGSLKTVKAARTVYEQIRETEQMVANFSLIPRLSPPPG